MKLHTSRPGRAAAACAAAVVLFACYAPARAQSAQQRRDERRAEMEYRQRALRALSGRLKGRPGYAPDTRPAYRQVAEDFEQLQLKNYSLSGAAEPGARLDYGQIMKEAAEVRRRASRLRSALSFPAAKDGGRQKRAAGALPPGGLKEAISSLDALVRSFVSNPVFQRPDVLDAENASKAGRELEEILGLSEQVRKAAEALAKAKNL